MFNKAEKDSERCSLDEPLKEFYVDQTNITLDQVYALREMIESNAGERNLDTFIRDNPAVLAMILRQKQTGHGGAWVIPQLVIKSRIQSTDSGLIPDYIVGGRNSDGFSWWVVELKGANANMFSRNRNKAYFSPTLTKGICQLIQYLDFARNSNRSYEMSLG